MADPINLERHEVALRKDRREIALRLLWVLTGIIAASFLLLLWALDSGKQNTDANFEHITELLNIVFGPVITLVGAATGYYFGSQNNEAAPPSEASTKPTPDAPVANLDPAREPKGPA